MSNPNLRTFSVHDGSVLDGEYSIQVNPDKFQETADHRLQGKTKKDRKFNIRIKQHDIFLLDALAEHEGVARSTLINKLLHDLLRDELMRVEEDDARALLAVTADKRATYNVLEQTWVDDAIGSECHSLLHNILHFNSRVEQQPIDHPGAPENPYNSDSFVGLQEKLKGIKI